MWGGRAGEAADVPGSEAGADAPFEIEGAGSLAGIEELSRDDFSVGDSPVEFLSGGGCGIQNCGDGQRGAARLCGAAFCRGWGGGPVASASQGSGGVGVCAVCAGCGNRNASGRASGARAADVAGAAGYFAGVDGDGEGRLSGAAVE